MYVDRSAAKRVYHNHLNIILFLLLNRQTMTMRMKATTMIMLMKEVTDYNDAKRWTSKCPEDTSAWWQPTSKQQQQRQHLAIAC